METIEIIIFISIFLFIGIMILNFITDIDFISLYKKIFNVIKDDEKQNFRELSKEQFVLEIFKFWKSSGMCEMPDSKVFYVENDESAGSDTINKTYLFDKIKEMNFCATLKSSSNNCGDREHVVFLSEINLPKLVKVHCNETDKLMYIYE